MKMNEEEKQGQKCGEKIGRTIKMLNGAFKQKFIKCAAEAELDEVTLMHGWIMGYLYSNQDKNIYQKTIESDFNINRSTVTTILKLMEKKGYIRREAVDGDARLKKIVLTPQGCETTIKTFDMLEGIERDMLSSIAPQELENFFAVAEKLMVNLSR